MKLFYLFVTVLAFVAFDTAAQNVSPTLHVVDNNRDYYVNRGIPGQTEDSQGINYVILHKVYTETLIAEHFVMGKITGVRGGGGAYDRKWTVDVNSASAYNANLANLVSYGEATKLVTLTYDGIRYMAVEITQAATLYAFSFTGYARNDALQLVKDDVVSDVQPFSATTPVGVQGRLGAGTTNPLASLHAHSQTNLNIAKFTFGGLSSANAFLDISNGTTADGAYMPTITGRSLTPGRPFGIWIQGEAEDVVPTAGNERFAAVVLDGRSKSGARLLNNNVLTVSNYDMTLMMVKADGSVGIGTTNTHGHKLAVNGSGLFTKVKVKASGAWPDYVFHPDYELPSLNEVEQYIQTHRHLQGIPSVHEVQKEGHDLGEMDKKLLQKIEELMLYTIAQQKQIDALAESNRQMKEELQELKASGR